MDDQEKPERHHPRKKNSEPLKPVLIFFILILLITAGAVLFFFTGTDKYLERSDDEPLVTEDQLSSKEEGARKAAADKDTATKLKHGTPFGTDDTVQSEESSNSTPTAESPEERMTRECKLLAAQVHEFFTHVDSKDYIKQFELQEHSQAYFIALANKLLKNPPVVSRESDDLYTILRNMAHFFRVIGKDNIILIKTILDRERDKIEDVAAEIYQWTARDTCNDDLLKFSPSLEEMYEYAGFFLNTMGGRSYLFRRDSRSRLLVNYYSVLLIERANQKGINRYGIDIAQIIPQLVQEIDSSSQLIYKENYIDSLYALLEKYQ